MRQLSYCSILFGATRPATEAGEDDVQVARDSARVASLAANHSNRGIRAYYFGLALLSWFVHPLALLPATAWVAIVLYRREFRRSEEHTSALQSLMRISYTDFC